MSAWRRSMSSTRKMSEHPSPAYNLPIGDTDTGTEAAEAAAAEVALGFGGEVAAAAAVEAAAAGVAAGAIDIAGSPRRLLLCQVQASGPPSLVALKPTPSSLFAE
jgi:hypothetical protein